MEQKDEPPANSQRMTDLEGTWVVVAYRRDDEMVTPVGEASLEIEGDRLAGTMGVNRVMGPIGENGPTGALATTLMAGPQHLMDQEFELLRLLNDVDGIEVGESGMTWSREGLKLVEFERSGTDTGAPSS